MKVKNMVTEPIKIKLIWPLKEIKELVKRYNELEKQINEKLEKLPNYGKRCNCDEPEVFYQIFLGHDFDEITRTCIKCGGYIDK